MLQFYFTSIILAYMDFEWFQAMRFNLLVVGKLEPITQSHASLCNCAHLCSILILY